MKKWTARQKLQMKRQIALISAVTLVVLLLLTGSLTAYQSIRAEQWRKQEEKERQALFVKVTKPEIRPALLTPNKNSRPQTKLKKVNGIVVHYTANPGTDAMATSDIIRHYDVTGKMCPKYYVKHKDAWTTLKKNISIELSRYSKKEIEK